MITIMTISNIKVIINAVIRKSIYESAKIGIIN